MQYLVIFEESKDGGYFAYIPDLEGCTSYGDTLAECKINVHEAIEIYLDELKNDGLPIPNPNKRFAEMVMV
jgi:predicted RNase H-like HicB family nuclease